MKQDRPNHIHLTSVNMRIFVEMATKWATLLVACVWLISGNPIFEPLAVIFSGIGGIIRHSKNQTRDY